MRYLNIDELCNELTDLIKNNYGVVHKNNFESTFYKAEQDILKKVKEIIRENKADIKKEVLNK